jgi:hypothetical protein
VVTAIPSESPCWVDSVLADMRRLAVARRLRLAELPPNVQAAVRQMTLDLRDGRL